VTPFDLIALVFAFLGIIGAAAFFWVEKNVAGFAFLVAFIIALASVSHQRVVFSSIILGVTVEKGIQRERSGS
jgi:hypothetical protein